MDTIHKASKPLEPYEKAIDWLQLSICPGPIPKISRSAPSKRNLNIFGTVNFYIISIVTCYIRIAHQEQSTGRAVRDPKMQK